MAFEEIFQDVAGKHKLDWHLMVEQCFRESRFDPLAVGADNDMGLMQIVPATWDDWAPKVGVYDPFDPDSNIAVAGAYLAWLREQLAKVNRPEPLLAAGRLRLGHRQRAETAQDRGWLGGRAGRPPRLRHRHHPGCRGQRARRADHAGQ